MNQNNHKRKKKMGFFRINSLKAAILTVLSAILIVIVVQNISVSNNASESTELSATDGKVAVLTHENFNTTIKNGITLVDFWAVWCMPCRIQGPIVEDVAAEMKGKVKVGKLDVDKNRAISTRYNIRSIPTIIIFQDGKPVKAFVGVQQKETLINALNEYL